MLSQLIPVMFIGVLNLFYALWDYCDEQLWDKHNPSDCTELSLMVGYTPGSEHQRLPKTDISVGSHLGDYRESDVCVCHHRWNGGVQCEWLKQTRR